MICGWHNIGIKIMRVENYAGGIILKLILCGWHKHYFHIMVMCQPQRCVFFYFFLIKNELKMAILQSFKQRIKIKFFYFFFKKKHTAPQCVIWRHNYLPMVSAVKLSLMLKILSENNQLLFNLIFINHLET